MGGDCVTQATVNSGSTVQPHSKQLLNGQAPKWVCLYVSVWLDVRLTWISKYV